MGAAEILREVLNLTSNVGALRRDVESLQVDVKEDRERIIKLENREEALASDMACKAAEAVSRMTDTFVTRLTRLEERLISRDKATPPLISE